MLASTALVLLAASAAPPPPADVLLRGGRVYTLAWDDPAPDGTPAANAPRTAAGWKPDAEAVAIRGDRIVFVGSAREAEAFRGPATRVIDLKGATVIPGLVDSHTHVAALGEARSRADLVGVQTEAEAVERVVAYAARAPKGRWIVGRGWDEGAWASRYPDATLLSSRCPTIPWSSSACTASRCGATGWRSRRRASRAPRRRPRAARS